MSLETRVCVCYKNGIVCTQDLCNYKMEDLSDKLISYTVSNFRKERK